MENKNKHRIRLEDVPRENNFKVPEGYFENFTSLLNKRLKEGEEGKSPTRRSFSGSRSILGLAAGLAFLALVSFTLIRFILNQNDNSGSPVIASNDSIQPKDYSNLGSPGDPSTEQIQDEVFYTDYMIDYLVAEDIDIGLIAEEL